MLLYKKMYFYRYKLILGLGCCKLAFDVYTYTYIRQLALWNQGGFPLFQLGCASAWNKGLNYFCRLILVIFLLYICQLSMCWCLKHVFSWITTKIFLLLKTFHVIINTWADQLCIKKLGYINLYNEAPRDYPETNSHNCER